MIRSRFLAPAVAAGLVALAAPVLAQQTVAGGLAVRVAPHAYVVSD
ncbi:MAG: hypothetical protein JO306_07145, partial [Gemmatimonadetes bacterium]|nr:hypothetical protein [Gemmatimonadota bacterium]